MRIRFLVVVFVLAATAAHAQLETDPAFGLSADFRGWLTANGYGSWNFQRTDVAGGSYGGRLTAGQAVVNHPVIFIHGNGDSAIGWRSSIEYLKSKDYTSAEIYATTWGPANGALVSHQYHSKESLTRIRAFIQAVKAYTGAAKVDVVAHSMGVTLARKAIKGGSAYDAAAGGTYALGAALTTSIDAFVGIAGANRGLTACYFSGASTAPTCSDRNGFYPGYLVGGLGPFGVSEILVDMNATAHYEGAYVATIWSSVDEIIGFGTIVYGQSTCRIAAQNGEVVFNTAPYGHFGVRDLTAYNQWRLIKAHLTN
ncbi:MAG TPA: alpha/beta fold hydrolase [Thermoanaerobaculia bacterium]|nr:alpha/beta fold hydrolase [Thermoanaerobaculia bacterium]